MVFAPMVRMGTLPTRLLALDYGTDIVDGEVAGKRPPNARSTTLNLGADRPMQTTRKRYPAGLTAKTI